IACRAAARGGSGPSGEHAPAVPVARADDAGEYVEVAAAEGLDVVDQRLVDESFLYGFELAADVLLVGDEDVAGLEVAGGVHAEVVVVGTADEPLVGRAGGSRVGEPDVRVQRDDRAVRVGFVVGF